MSESWPKKYYRWPGYLPYPTPLQRSQRPVPNRSSVDSPQAQFAPLYLAPGSPSFQAYSYTKQDVPLSHLRPVYKANSLGNEAVHRIRAGASPWSMTASNGDIARLPNQADIMRYQSMDYGDGMAYELAPLQAVPHETFDMAGLDAELAGASCGCHGNPRCACANPATETWVPVRESSSGFSPWVIGAVVIGAAVLWATGVLDRSPREDHLRSEALGRMGLGGRFY